MGVDNREPNQTTMTKPHKRLHSLLRVMGFEVEDEVRVGKYSLDCFVREAWCGFECDGKRIHAGVRKQKKDGERDKWIYENAGIPVMRIQSDALQFKLWDELKVHIMEFIDSHAGDQAERERKGKGLDV